MEMSLSSLSALNLSQTIQPPKIIMPPPQIGIPNQTRDLQTITQQESNASLSHLLTHTSLSTAASIPFLTSFEMPKIDMSTIAEMTSIAEFGQLAGKVGVFGLLGFAGWKLRATSENYFNQRILKKTDITEREKLVQQRVNSAIHWGVFALGGLSTYVALGGNFNVILGGAAIITAALGFAARGFVAPILATAALTFEDNYKIGDYIECGDAKGYIINSSMRYTMLIEFVDPEPKSEDAKNDPPPEVQKIGKHVDIEKDANGKIPRIHTIPNDVLTGHVIEYPQRRATQEQLDQFLKYLHSNEIENDSPPL